MKYEFKSNEEQMFADWLDEAKNVGFVNSWTYEPSSFLLIPAKTYVEVVKTKTKTKKVDKNLHLQCTYTPDFCVQFTESGKQAFEIAFKKTFGTRDGLEHYFDTKGLFDKRQGDGRFFSVIQKLMFLVHGIWVEKVIPKTLFEKTYAPENVIWMKSRKVPTKTKIGTKCKAIQEFVYENNRNKS